ncbi:CDP-alcohol phosphatidyltransferase family protein [Salinispirillum sp. LH 10-3-1]|uniref:CDP-alcohol phosphatidyltransferase family protein n=1 Tax=Salinispirillum sp. LH 10-3-1 TaxID=2952525 RepID=A0AB38YBV8_9GAMM
MLDRYALPLIKPPLNRIAKTLHGWGITANQVTVTGFFVGLMAVPAIMANLYFLGLVFILLNRVADGIDGELARLTEPTDAGGFLDITLDFFFYQAIVFAFALAHPANTLWALILMLSFVGTGISFLSFAVMAEKRQIKSLTYPNKGLHYMAGLAEGTETIAIFVVFCLFPHWFPWLAGAFALLCFVTTGMRVHYGYKALRSDPVN